MSPARSSPWTVGSCATAFDRPRLSAAGLQLVAQLRVLRVQGTTLAFEGVTNLALRGFRLAAQRLTGLRRTQLAALVLDPHKIARRDRAEVSLAPVKLGRGGNGGIGIPI